MILELKIEGYGSKEMFLAPLDVQMCLLKHLP